MKPLLIKTILFLLLMVGFLARLSYMQAGIYHVDEFISMLAATMVAAKGLPILPSGLLYDHGLLYSFIAGLFVALLGFSEEIARWPTVLISTATIAVYYSVARIMFNSHQTGLIAAALATFDELSILWGGRARMYSPAAMFMLLSLAWLLRGTLQNPSAKHRTIFLLCLMLALLSHTVILLTLPPLALTLMLFTLLYRRAWLSQAGLWQQALVGGMMLLGILWIVAQGQVSSTVGLQTESATTAPLGLTFLQGFVQPGLAWSRFDDLLGLFITDTYGWLWIPIAFGLGLTLYRLWRKTTQFADIAFLFLLLYLGLMLFEQGALLSRNWQKTRYLFIIALPAYMLMSAHSLTLLLDWLTRLIPRPSMRPAVATLLGVGLVMLMWGEHATYALRAEGAGSYKDAFEYVAHQWQEGDSLMTVHPSAAYLYTGRSDYYANQETAKVITDEASDEEGLVDRYIGSPLVDEVAQFNQILADSPRVWFVVDENRLYHRYEPLFTQQIFSQMAFQQNYAGNYVFLSRPNPLPLPAEPPHMAQANFNNLIELGGYTTAIVADNSLAVGLYWRPVGVPTSPYKVFMQLRNHHGETLAQADHFMFDGLLTLDVWLTLQAEHEWLRESGHLALPTDVAPTEEGYLLYVGLYDPTTLQRLPLLNDSSGENAFIIPLEP